MFKPIKLVALGLATAILPMAPPANTALSKTSQNSVAETLPSAEVSRIFLKALIRLFMEASKLL